MTLTGPPEPAHDPAPHAADDGPIPAAMAARSPEVKTVRPLDLIVAPDLAAALARFGRTEDVAVSPDRRRLAIAGYGTDAIALLAVDMQRTGSRPSIEVTGVTTVTHPQLDQPHGIEFLDHTTLLVANRHAEVLRVDLPSVAAGRFGSCDHRASARVVLDDRAASPVQTPGSLTIRRTGQLAEVIVCNNYADNVTRHVVECGTDGTAIGHEVLLRHRLSIPDGVAVSPSGRWLAISNHLVHQVFIYRFDDELGPESEPIGVLDGTNYPHGLQFTDDDRHLVVADAGLPYLVSYHAPDGDWSGHRTPSRVVRVMDDTTFVKGRHNPQEGGPKGVAVLADDVVVVTSEHQQFACFHGDDVFAEPRAASVAAEHDAGHDAERSVRRALRRADEHEAALARSATDVAQVRAELAQVRTDADARRAQVDELQSVAEATAAEHHRTRAHLEQSTRAVVELRALVEQAEQRAAEANRRAAAAERRAATAAAQVDRVHRSSSWRFTGPARRVADVVKRLRAR